MEAIVHLASVNASPDALVITLMCLYGVWYAATGLIFLYHWQRHTFTGSSQRAWAFCSTEIAIVGCNSRCWTWFPGWE
jgi:hypothetical protein